MGRFLLQLLLTYDFELLPTLGGPWEAAVATPILAAEDDDGLSQAPEARRPGCCCHIVGQLIRPLMNDGDGFLHH